ncbi:hypothetical protein RUM43_011894 [Polyplax serrata]|uniref:RRM domain-containing protein n=1 Tax=Polyplax serrata TaxID=468196 RepID=A0AAN8P6N1_POLSC
MSVFLILILVFDLLAGESKGYGFVEYASKETAQHAKNNLDGMLINDVTLCADFIDSTHITFESLHSKCLYVDNLPHNYRDMGEFRRKFSKVINPPYCQIALKNGCPQNWGLVEFNTGEDAETTLTQLNGCELKDKKLRISYYIPGVRAINLYLKLLNETDNNRGKGNGLLPTPPPGVFQSFKNLQKQNPIFAQSIQNIMVTEQQLGVGNVNSSSGNQTYEDGKSSNKNGSGPRKKQGPISKGTPSSNASSESPGSEVPHDQQAAFLRLLAGQNPALLQTPQMASFLKQPKGALNGAPVLVPPTALATDASGLALPAAIPTGVSAIPVIPTLSDFAGSGLYPDAVKAAPAPVNLIGVNPAIDAVTTASFPSGGSENGAALSMATAGQAGLWNQVAVLSDIGEKASASTDKNLLGPHIPFARQMNPMTQRPQRLTALIPGHPLTRGIIPIPTAIPQVAEPRAPTNGFHPAWFPQAAVLDSPQFTFPPAMVPAASATAETGLTSLLNQNPLLQYLGDMNSGLVNEQLSQFAGNLSPYASYKLTNGQAAAGADGTKNSYANEDNSGKKAKGEWNGKSVHSSPPLNNSLYRSSSTGSSHSKLSDSQGSADSDQGAGAEAQVAGRLPQSPIVSHPGSLPHVWPTVGAMPHPAAALTQTPQRPIGFEAQILSKSNIRTTPPSYVAYQSPDWTSNLYGSPLPANVTPVGQKRKYTRFLPSPEPSPEGSYIGQHSQGIGGHYVDSWPKRKKKN